MDQDESATRLAAALSQGAGPEFTIGYLDGFLAGSGMLLVHDRRLFGLVDDWLATQSDDGFTATLPYLRRTFARFTAAERRSLRDQARARTTSDPPAPGDGAETSTEASPSTDLDVLDALLGLGDDA